MSPETPTVVWRTNPQQRAQFRIVAEGDTLEEVAVKLREALAAVRQRIREERQGKLSPCKQRALDRQAAYHAKWLELGTHTAVAEHFGVSYTYASEQSRMHQRRLDRDVRERS